MSRIVYILLYVWIATCSRLPFWLLYFYSHSLYLIIYYVLGYRRRVVRANMAASFPDRSPMELRRMERAFYRHFADYIVETIKMAAISEEEIRRRMLFLNPQLVDGLMNSGHSCILMATGHFGNWEWCTAGGAFFEDARVWQIYRPLRSKAFDRLYIRLRTRFGAQGIKKNESLRSIIRLRQSGARSIIAVLADQTPSLHNINYRTRFLNRDTAFLDGIERIAKKLDLPVIYADVKQLRRGYYTVEFLEITSAPRQTPDFFITEKYARLMEQTILRNPSLWLWTHKRWKHTANNTIDNINYS
ncbi:MAG: lysophospholipid acyltransferase family protein [Tannerellaceae bacterium]|jgi:KDO2-lipid IV(A) lauroyltransferase|nr:lysophospholipid acyltransferase family protein [Tannerellaceae bacterium]